MKRAINFVLVLFVVATASMAAAKTREVTAQATGFGDTPETAVANALVEAARQSLGVSVLLDPNFRTESYQWVESEKMVSGSWTSKPEAQAPSLANVVGYKVISTKEIKDKLWQADIEARLLQNASIGPDKSNLPTLVVAPVRTDEASYDVGGAVSGDKLAKHMHRELITSFTLGGRFRVLDRQYPKTTQSELNIAASGLSPFEHAKLGQQLGADLVMTTEVEKFQLGRETQKFYGAQLNSMEPFIRINYQLIDTATREIITAGTWVDQQSQNNFRARLREADIEPAREKNRVGEVLYPYVARQLSGEVVDVLYPLRVLSAVSSNAIYITQGEGRLEKGDLMSAREPQPEINDPDSGVAIRLQGPIAATVRVTDVTPSYAVAELVTGNLKLLSGNAVLHVEATPSEAPVGIERPLTPGSSDAPIKW